MQLVEGSDYMSLPTHTALGEGADVEPDQHSANEFSKCLQSAAHHLIGNDSAFHVSHLKRCNYTPGDETLTIL